MVARALDAIPDELLILAEIIPDMIRKRVFQRPDVFPEDHHAQWSALRPRALGISGCQHVAYAYKKADLPNVFGPMGPDMQRTLPPPGVNFERRKGTSRSEATNSGLLLHSMLTQAIRTAVFAGCGSVPRRRLPSADHSLIQFYSGTSNAITTLMVKSIVFSVAFSRDGTRLAAGCRDTTIRLFDVASRRQAAELRGHTDYVHAVAWSPDGTRLVSGSGDFTVRVWDSLSPADPGQTSRCLAPAPLAR